MSSSFSELLVRLLKSEKEDGEDIFEVWDLTEGDRTEIWRAITRCEREK
jgi:predicted CopG family antitoxin